MGVKVVVQVQRLSDKADHGRRLAYRTERVPRKILNCLRDMAAEISCRPSVSKKPLVVRANLVG